MLNLTDLPPQIVPAVEAFARRLAHHVRAHRDARLEVHEDGVLAAWRAESAAVLAGVVQAATTGADPQAPPPRSRCPGCGRGCPAERWRPRQVQTRLGAVRLLRTRYHCGGCGRRWSAADRTLGLGPRQRTSAGLAGWEARLAALTTFREAATLLDELAGVAVGSETLRTQAERVGTAYEGQQRRAIAEVAATHQPPRQPPYQPAPGTLVVQADGVLVRYRNRGPDGSPWHEVKLGVVGGWTGARPAAHLQAPSYVAARERAAPFARRLGAEAARRGALDVVGWRGRAADDGFSGASLVRPALERLRDVAAAGEIERLYVYSPDRLARRYAYQVLLIDELHRAGVELVFLNRAVSQTPEDELLLQVQGVVAEYERAKLLERVRRGRRHGAQAGALSVIGHAPYGYRHITKGEGGGQARYKVALDEARVVRQAFEWVGRERVSMAEVARRLMAAKVPTATGLTKWDRSQIWTMLRNPAYQGAAAFGKTRMGPLRPRLRAPRGHTLQPRRPTSSYGTPPEDWITIPVPPLVSSDLFATVQEQLQENRRRAKRSARCTDFLGQGLAVCTCCGYAYCGGHPGRAVRTYGYYRCPGTDRFRFGGQAVCENPATRSDLMDAAVWAEIRAVLQEPSRLLAEYQRRLESARAPTGRDEVVLLEGQVRRLRQGISRLIDSYAEGLIEKAEFEPRVKRLKERVTTLERQLEHTRAVMAEHRDLHLVLGHVEDFAATVARKLDHLDWSARRAIVRALVKQVEVDYTEIRIVFRVGPGPVVLDTATRLLQDREGRRSCGRGV